MMMIGPISVFVCSLLVTYNEDASQKSKKKLAGTKKCWNGVQVADRSWVKTQLRNEHDLY